VEIGAPAWHVDQISEHSRPSEEHVGANHFAFGGQQRVRVADGPVHAHACRGVDGAWVVEFTGAR
jgi:hypothetical protein